MALDEPSADDVVYDTPTFRLVVAKALLEKYTELRIDWRQSPWYEGLLIRSASPTPPRC